MQDADTSKLDTLRLVLTGERVGDHSGARFFMHARQLAHEAEAVLRMGLFGPPADGRS